MQWHPQYKKQSISAEVKEADVGCSQTLHVLMFFLLRRPLAPVKLADRGAEVSGESSEQKWS